MKSVHQVASASSSRQRHEVYLSSWTTPRPRASMASLLGCRLGSFPTLEGRCDLSVGTILANRARGLSRGSFWRCSARRETSGVGRGVLRGGFRSVERVVHPRPLVATQTRRCAPVDLDPVCSGVGCTRLFDSRDRLGVYRVQPRRDERKHAHQVEVSRSVILEMNWSILAGRSSRIRIRPTEAQPLIGTIARTTCGS